MPTETRPPLSPIRRTKHRIQREREMKWIGEHRHEYAGQWVALDGDRIVAHGFDADPVFAAAKAQTTIPFLVRFHPDDALPTVGGW